jgi:(p)ppGpp synthase/HD superfamily hydrolase
LEKSIKRPGNISDERNIRLQARANQGKGSRLAFEQRLESITEQLMGAGGEAFHFATGIDYKHGNLSSDTYLAHPLRVGLMALDFIPDLSPDTFVIALIHNVLEVGSVTGTQVEQSFGRNVATTIENLTVDRPQQWDAEYKKIYYARISAGYIGGCQVKVLDKLDNLFMLGLNPDDQIRGRYIAEIREHVLPMAAFALPTIHPYMQLLVDEVELTGHFKLPDGDN